MSETTTFHTAPAGCLAALYNYGDPPGWEVVPVIGWAVEITEGTNASNGDASVFARPVVLDPSTGYAFADPAASGLDVLTILPPTKEITATVKRELDELVADHTRLLERERERRRREEL
jgi:hypothetical protein